MQNLHTCKKIKHKYNGRLQITFNNLKNKLYFIETSLFSLSVQMKNSVKGSEKQNINIKRNVNFRLKVQASIKINKKHQASIW